MQIINLTKSKFPYHDKVLRDAIVQDYISGKTLLEIVLSRLTPLGFCSQQIVLKILREANAQRPKQTPEEKFKESLVQVGKCLVFNGTIFHGNGWIRINKDVRMTHHRAALHFAGIEVPEGKEIHHKCFNLMCCEILHLEILTPEEHQQRHSKQ